ncbi:hypothetical protein SLEP1_g24587 [Rubroshorea leprosula]|uniref:Uncharacterized protein n=1 Tax=Rubroshorea leprosula TaxID=152421 RepID=A0AAV5JGE0_9ROSI|nr:hypothetical protein SLEP1_g24587 [Rubroshorea leprosula]
MMCCGRDLPRRLGGSVAGRRRARLGGGCSLLLLVNNRGGCWDFGRLGAFDLAQNNFSRVEQLSCPAGGRFITLAVTYGGDVYFVPVPVSVFLIILVGML